MQTSTELLNKILHVVGEINNRQSQDAAKSGPKGDETAGTKDIINISTALNSFAKVKPKARKEFISFSKEILQVVKESNKGKDFQLFSEGLINISNALPSLVESLDELGRMKNRRVDRSLNTLRKLYDLMYELGDGGSARKVARATKLFDNLGKSLRRIARPLKVLSSFLTYLGISFVVFAAGIVAASALLKLSSPMGVVGAVLGVVTVLVGVVGLLALTNKFIEPGIKAVKGMGKAFAFLALGILGFTLSLLLTAAYLGTGDGFKGIGKALLVVGGVVLLMVGAFALLGFAEKFVKPGIKTTKGMGLGLLILIGGVFLFAAGLVGIAALLGESQNLGGIALAMAGMGVAIAAIVGMFWLLGKAQKTVLKGTLVALLVAVGIAAIGFSIYFLAQKAQQIAGMMAPGEEGKTSKIFGIEVPPAVAGLGMIGMVFLGAVGLFALLGIPVVAGLVALGASTAILVSGSLFVLGLSVAKLVEVSAKVPEDFSDKLGLMIGGLLEGMLKGMEVLTGGKRGVRGFAEFIKNSAKIFAITGILMTASIALSMFARALTAFAELSQMRPIIGHKDNGEPIFGQKVDISQVGTNISTSISQFLTALIDSTEGLTRRKAGAIRKMGRALTGRRGILTAVIQFADVLKTFAQFGPEGKIGFVDLVPDGVDEDGNPKFKKVASTVTIEEVTGNIINSFGTFVDLLTADTDRFSIDGRDGRKMKRLAEVLLGKKGRKGREKYGLLQPIQAFSETLTIYAKYGADLKIPVLDEEGNVTSTMSVEDVAGNIVKTLSAFTDSLASSDIKGDTNKAVKNLKKFDDLVDRLSKISNSLDGLSKLSLSIKDLSGNLVMLATTLDALDISKLEQVSDIGSAYLKKTNDYSASNQRIMAGATGETTYEPTSGMTRRDRREYQKEQSKPIGKAPKEPDWETIAAQIGNSVGAQIVSAMKNNQMKFAFSNVGSNEGVIEFDT